MPAIKRGMEAKSLLVVGLSEIAKLAGVSKQTAHEWTKRESFPHPFATLAMGKIWVKGEVVRWLKTKAEQEQEKV